MGSILYPLTKVNIGHGKPGKKEPPRCIKSVVSASRMKHILIPDNIKGIQGNRNIIRIPDIGEGVI